MPTSRKTPRTWTIGLAVSGGADSTALLAVLADLRDALDFDAVVLHVDHGLRPDSHADARFVEALAARFDLPCRTLRSRIRRRPRESLEMAARRTRLAFFARMTRELGLDAIATGHHADDVAETFIMRMARGAGPEGLAGLKPVSHVDGITFIRPLLGLRDADLRTYLRRRGLTWREDSTNADTSILRNKVRHVILPFREGRAPSRPKREGRAPARPQREGPATSSPSRPRPATRLAPNPSAPFPPRAN